MKEEKKNKGYYYGYYREVKYMIIGERENLLKAVPQINGGFTQSGIYDLIPKKEFKSIFT